MLGARFLQFNIYLVIVQEFITTVAIRLAEDLPDSEATKTSAIRTALREIAMSSRQRMPRMNRTHARGFDSSGEGSEWSWLQDEQPLKKDLMLVKSWASEIGGSFSHKVWLDANPAALLLDLTEQQQYEADGVDEDRQILMHLLRNHFYKRSRSWVSKATMYTSLAQDYQVYSHARNANMSSKRLLQMVLHAQDDLTNKFAHSIIQYSIGLRKRFERKKALALIFTCSFGNGHKSASSAVRRYLQADGYDVLVIDTTRDKDFRTFYVEVGDYYFNHIILEKQLYQLANFVDAWKSAVNGILVPSCPAPICEDERRDTFRFALLRTRPDLIVTVYHMDLMHVLELAKEIGNLPLMHVSTDMDIKMREVFEAKPNYPRMLVSVPFDIKASWDTIKPLSRDQAFLSGYPVRDAFLQLRDEETINQERSSRYPPDAKLVLVMSGGSGPDLPWPNVLAQNGFNESRLHVIVIAGANDGLKSTLEGTLSNSLRFGGREFLQGDVRNVTVEVAVDPRNRKTEAPFFVSSAELALLLDMADIVITKPGGGSTAEIAYRGTPAVFDASHGLLHWEEFTVEQFEQSSRGVRINSVSASALNEACMEAFGLGRSTKIAEHPRLGGIIDAKALIQAAARRVRSTPCIRCSVF